jgi:hypothetical protein
VAIKQLEAVMTAPGALKCWPSALAHAVDAQPYDRYQLGLAINEDDLGGAWAERERMNCWVDEIEAVSAGRIVLRE